jgi:HEAT repeat protein
MKRLLPCIVVLISLMAGTAAPSGQVQPSLPDLDDDERLLDSAGLPCEGPGLLEVFRARARTEAEPGRIDDLVRRLTGPSLEDQIQAGSDLVALGPLAVSGLRRVANDLETPDARERARRCLALVEGPQGAALVSAAARVVARRKPAGAVEALLAYVPFADNDEVTREVTAALRAVAVSGGRADPALGRALADAVPVRRAIAGAVLSQAGGPEQRQAAEKLLKDKNPEVRMGAAVALAKANHAPAVPVLIDLLVDLPTEKRTQVEEVLQELAGEWAPAGGPVAEDEIARRIRRDAWAAWWANTDGPALLAVLKKRTLTPEEREKAQAAITRLGDKSYAVREKAVVEVVARGRVMLPMLREAIKTSALEVVQRAQRCIQRIEAEPANRLPGAALRLLGLRKPAGAAETILAYLPFAEEDNLADVHTAMARVAQRDGKPDPAMVRALEDKLSFVRAAAGEALALGGGPDALPAVRKLLEDDDKTVRLRVGMALAPRDARAVPVLIAMIPESPAEQAWQVHDFLAQMAGEKAPPPPQDNAESRKTAGAAWATWWKENAEKADLTKLASTQGGGAWLGYTLIVEHSTGKIMELGRDRKPRWSFQGTQNPTDAVVVSNNRVVVAEYGGRKVSERDLKGNIIWQKQLNANPHNVQRLPNGNTIVATNIQILELDRTGKELYSIRNQQFGFVGGYKTRNGQIVTISQNGVCAYFDTTGKQLNSFQTNRGNAWMDLQANGRILLATNGGNQIAEYSPDGKLLLSLTVQQVSTVTGLPNGNLLVTSNSLGRVQEMDRKGRVIWEYRANGPFRARGR